MPDTAAKDMGLQLHPAAFGGAWTKEVAGRLHILRKWIGSDEERPGESRLQEWKPEIARCLKGKTKILTSIGPPFDTKKKKKPPNTS